MVTDNNQRLAQIVTNLSAEDALRGLFHQHLEGNPLPSGRAISEIVKCSRAILFPGYFGPHKINRHTVHYHMGINVERLYELLVDQISAALCFQSADNEFHARPTVSSEQVVTLRVSAPEPQRAHCSPQQVQQQVQQLVDALKGEPVEEHIQGQQCLCCNEEIKDIAAQLALSYIESLEDIRAKLAADVRAAFNGDPAATCFGEVICCYPGIRAIGNYRIAHQLLKLGVPLIPRTITEMAHSETGIDIHPGATIGESFAIDHGTGVVIGETCIIGNNVKLYQGVTLGAKSIPTDDTGAVLNVPRHPILEDDVVVYANATVLGRITIGKGAVIGGNVWVTSDVPAGAKLVQRPAHA